MFRLVSYSKRELKGMKIHILEDTDSGANVVSGTVILVGIKKVGLKDVLNGVKTMWVTETLGEDWRVVTTVELSSIELIAFLQDSDIENLCVSVGDSRQLVGMMLCPRVPINLSESTIEYFDHDAFFTHILESFLRDIHFPEIEPE